MVTYTVPGMKNDSAERGNASTEKTAAQRAKTPR